MELADCLQPVDCGSRWRCASVSAATERIAARREIARRVAHEIKNPLAPIRAAVETLRRLRARNDPAFDEYFDEATRTVLDEVARISNIVTGVHSLRASATAQSRAPRSLPNRGAKGGEPARDERCRVELVVAPCPIIHADNDQLVQVLTNLIQNGIEAAKTVATPRFGSTRALGHGPRRALGARQRARRGRGDARAPVRALRQRPSPKAPGSGLAIVHRIVVEHGGEIVYTRRTRWRRSLHAHPADRRADLFDRGAPRFQHPLSTREITGSFGTREGSPAPSV